MASDAIVLVHASAARNAFGGIENSVHNLAAGFASTGSRAFVYHGAGTETGWKRSGAIPSYSTRHLFGAAHEAALLKERCSTKGEQIRRELARLCTHKRITLCQAHDPVWGLLPQLETWDLLPNRMYLRLHMLHDETVLASVVRKRWSGISVVSDYVRRGLMRNCPRLPELVVIPNSIDTNSFVPRPHPAPEQPVILCHSRMAAKKGTLVVLSAFRLLRRAHPTAALWLSGGAPSFKRTEHAHVAQKVKDFISVEGLGNSVRILGRRSWASLPRLVQEADLVVVPSLDETFGRTALEGLACGRPTVVTDAGNLPALVQDAAVIAEAGSPESLAAAMDRALTDQRLRRRLERSGPIVAQKYSNVRIAREFGHFYEATR